MAIRRYPGVQPFGDDDTQRELFRGRDEEKYELLQLVLAERLVLLFARSGIGKSSLINAGLLQQLRERGHFPMVVRVSGALGGPIASLYEGIRAAATDAHQRWGIASEPGESYWNRTSLWHFFKTSSFWRGPKLLRPVLVIDQFEELFTLYSTAEYRQFIDELSDLVRGTRPRESADREAPGLSDAPPEVKVMLALREDFYAQLEELRQRIPAIYKAPFRLEPLSREQARHAIVEPAGLEDDELAVPPFDWADDAVTKVLDFLSQQQMGEGRKQVGDEIEPFQLQLICQHVEDLVGERGLATITADDLGGDEGLTRVLSSFYESSLTKICDRFKDEPNLRQKLEKLCEYGFITAKGRRLLREESTIMQEDEVSVEILRELVELRLLRKEPRVGDNYYELTHDTLIEPIKLSRLHREERAARALEEQRAREAREHKDRVRKLKRRARIAAAAAVLLLVTGGAAWVHQRTAVQRAEAAAKEAEIGKQAAVQKSEAAVQIADATAREAQAAAKEAEIGKQAAVQKSEAAVQIADATAREAQKAATLATQAVLLAKSAEAARTVVEVNVELAKLQEEQIRARQQVEEARTVAKSGDEQARLQLEQVVANLTQIEQRAAQQTTVLNAAASVRANTQQQATESQVVPANDKNVEREIEAIKQNLGEIEKKAQIQDVASSQAAATKEELLQDGQAEASAPAASQEPATDETNGSTEAQESAALAFEQFMTEFNKLSLCEKFDAVASFEPDRPFGEQAEFKLIEQAKLNQLGGAFPVVVTQSNLVAGPAAVGPADIAWQQCESLTPENGQRYDTNTTVCVYSWISYTGDQRSPITLQILDPDQKPIFERRYNIGRNPLMGDRVGYRIWTGKAVKVTGQHQILIYGAKASKDGELLCRTTFDVG